MTSGPIDKMPNMFSINDAVNPYAEANEPSKPERLEVAHYDGGSIYVGTVSDMGMDMDLDVIVPGATGIPYAREDEAYFRDLFTTSGTHKNLLLKEGTAMYQNLSQSISIDTRVTHCFQFLDDIYLDPKTKYIIRGRKYACLKIEYNIDDNGVSPIKRGYFYEIND